MPRVSVITATYNWSSVLRCAIESVARQTFGDWELLVVGDGCTDDSGEVVASFCDPRVQWHNLPQNHGHQFAPNNFGLSRARGEYIAYLGHDDVWHRDHLALLVEKMDTSRADVTWSHVEIIGPPPVHFRALGGVVPESGFDGTTILFPTSLMHRRAVTDELGGWRDYREIVSAPDREIVDRFFAAGKKFAPIRRLTAFKFSAGMRRNCYVEKPSHEQREYLRRMDGEPDFIERELLAIAASYETRHPEVETHHKPETDDLAGRGVNEARRRRGALGAERPEITVFPPICEGKIHFDQAEALPFLWCGWSGPEQGFRWSEGADAGLVFAAQANEPLSFVMSCGAFLAKGKIERQIVHVQLNGQQIATLDFDEEAWQTREIALPAAHVRERNELIFQFPGAASPLSFGINEDARVLAMQVQWFALWGGSQSK